MQNPTGRPTFALLEEFAPRQIWQAAFREAERGPLRRHNVGAVIFDPVSARLLSSATNLFPDASPFPAPAKPALHAETVALSLLPRADLRGATVLTVALKKSNGGHCTSSQPCSSCLARLAERGVREMLFVERSDGGWHVHRREVAEYAFQHRERLASSDGTFARVMRLPRLTRLSL
jgi:tRNA(Arg) A34 adenosine deaminase TadA